MCNCRKEQLTYNFVLRSATAFSKANKSDCTIYKNARNEYYYVEGNTIPQGYIYIETIKYNGT